MLFDTDNLIFFTRLSNKIALWDFVITLKYCFSLPSNLIILYFNGTGANYAMEDISYKDV